MSEPPMRSAATPGAAVPAARAVVRAPPASNPAEAAAARSSAYEQRRRYDILFLRRVRTPFAHPPDEVAGIPDEERRAVFDRARLHRQSLSQPARRASPT